MLSEPFLSQHRQLANQQVETWRQINPRDNSLLRKKLSRANREAIREIKERIAQIRFENRLSFNPTGTELQIVKMWGEKINELAEAVYAIFCKEWEEVQGNKKTPIFVRAVSAQLLRMIEQWGNSAAYGARILHLRRGGIGKLLDGSYTKLAQSVCEDWKERLDIEAGELKVQETAQRHTGRLSLGSPPSMQAVHDYADFVASSDYRTVRYRGKEHLLTRNQSIMVKLLHDAYQHGTPAVGKATLLAAIEAETSRVRDSFKNSPLWGTLVVSNTKPRGTYQLDLK